MIQNTLALTASVMVGLFAFGCDKGASDKAAPTPSAAQTVQTVQTPQPVQPTTPSPAVTPQLGDLSALPGRQATPAADAASDHVTARNTFGIADTHVCGDPSKRCTIPNAHFEPFDLPWVVPATFTKGQTKSAPFYIVLIQSKPVMNVVGAKCDGFFDEAARAKLQALFPTRMVFTSRSQCGHPVSYTKVEKVFNFVAVYAGEDQKEGNEVLAAVKKHSELTGPNLRQIEAIYEQK